MKKRNVKSISNPYHHKRDAFQKIKCFIERKDTNPNYKDKILILYGLKRTGKTTLLEQFISELDEKEKCSFFIIDSNDTMDDIEDTIENEQKKGIKYIIFDEITNVKGFVDESASLSNVYAKEGMVIILSGTDSLGFHFASRDALMGKCVKIGTTHIPFAEYCRVLDVNDMDDYIRHGGLMPDGDSFFVNNYEESCDYIESVASNIANSLSKAPKTSCLEKLSKDELTVVVDKIVEKYSGVFDEKIIQNQLKKASVTYVNEKIEDFSDDFNFIHYMTRESTKKNIAKDFLPLVNADSKIGTTVEADMVAWLIKYLTDMKVLSTVKKHEYTKNENNIWEESVETNEYYIVQPTIKYFHLVKGKEFIEKSNWYRSLDDKAKKYLQDKLEEKIMGDMLEQIVLFDTTSYLSCVKYIDNNGNDSEKYLVCKPVFTLENKKLDSEKSAEYDMLIQDRETNEYYGFEIKHSTESVKDQYKHLSNFEIKEIIDKQYGNRKNVSVLYRGQPFKSSDDVCYFNVNEFLKTLDKTRDIKKTVDELSQNLEVKKVLSSKDIESSDNIVNQNDKIINNNYQSFATRIDQLVNTYEEKNSDEYDTI